MTLEETGSQINLSFTAIVNSTEPSSSAILNEQQRFQLWGHNLGLYHRGHSSLDYRFRDSPLLFNYALGLLRDLNDILHRFEALLKEEIGGHANVVKPSDSQNLACDPSSSDEDDSEDDLLSYQVEPLEKVLLKNIVSIIDKLYRLAFKIRNPAMRIGFPKGWKFTVIDPETGIDIINQFKIVDLARISDLLRSHKSRAFLDGSMNYLVQRLIQANMYRRRQFEYWKHRKAKFEDHPGLEPSKTVSEPSTATHVNDALIDSVDTASIISGSTSVLSTGSNADQYCSIPPPPKLDAAAKEFECPYCFTLLPAETTRIRKWETHVYRDLRPYICTFEECKNPHQQYDSLHDWIAHEVSTHMSNKSSDIRQLSYPLNNRDCRFCDKRNVPFNHVAWHLRRIACFTLPLSAVGEDRSDVSSQNTDAAAVDSDSLGEISAGAPETSIHASSARQEHQECLIDEWKLLSQRMAELSNSVQQDSTSTVQLDGSGASNNDTPMTKESLIEFRNGLTTISDNLRNFINETSGEAQSSKEYSPSANAMTDSEGLLSSAYSSAEQLYRRDRAAPPANSQAPPSNQHGPSDAAAPIGQQMQTFGPPWRGQDELQVNELSFRFSPDNFESM
ncbi:hypothetical protein N7456_000349 [Penicillium angulare]|uniref:Oxidoreductase acuF-like C2H2 type zinc-finger domain-containing protein n=1 Tax=Penicillium angulare TaxID=116970 RepID=A0A9W9GCD2_9EURO|nr:hypothetical protein N7456_000349 [Penicillium angulare]